MSRESSRKPNVIFLSFLDATYSRSAVILHYPSEEITKEFIQLDSKSSKMITELIKLRKEIDKNSVVVVMSPCHKIAIFAHLILRCPIVLDAGWPLTDGEFSRRKGMRRIQKLPYIYLIDFLSFHSSHKVLTESKLQSYRIEKHFFLAQNRLQVRHSGFNEDYETGMHQSTKKLLELKRELNEIGLAMTVLFRGKINQESGFDVIQSAAGLLEHEAAFIFLVGKKDYVPNIGRNCIVVRDVSMDEMSEIYSLSDVALGQISKNPRLRHTIPHKAFEAGYFGKCYISTHSSALAEVFDENSILHVKDVNSQSLAQQIRVALNQNTRTEKSQAIAKDYNRNCSQKVLNQQFESLIDNFVQ